MHDIQLVVPCYLEWVQHVQVSGKQNKKNRGTEQDSPVGGSDDRGSGDRVVVVVVVVGQVVGTAKSAVMMYTDVFAGAEPKVRIRLMPRDPLGRFSISSFSNQELPSLMIYEV